MKQTPTTLGAFRSADIATIPIATDVLTITSAMVIAQAESGTADDIATITPSIESINATDRYFVMIEADAGDTITLKHGTGNLTLKGAADIELTGGQRALLFGSLTDGFTDFATSSAGGGGSGAISADTLVLNDGSEVTIATGAITATAARHTVDTEADAASDDLITVNGLAANEVCIITAAHTDRTVVVKNGGGNISSATGADITLDDTVKAVALMGDIAGTGVNAYPLQSSGAGDTLPVPDTTALVKGSVDDSKQFRIEVDGFTAGQTRVATPPDENFTMMGLATAQTPTNKTISASANTVGMGSGVTKTIASGVAAAGTDRNLIIAAESGTADDLIEVTGLVVGESVLLRADAGDTITVVHNSGSATVKIHLHDNANVTLDEQNPLRLTLVATNVLVEDVQGSAGGGGALATVNATKVYKPPSNISVTSMSYVNVDATNYAITETMIGDGVVMLTLLFLANKATAGTGTLRWTDGTNFSAEFVISFATIVSYVFVASMPTTAGSTTYTLQAKSSDGNALNIRETNPINISLVEVY